MRHNSLNFLILNHPIIIFPLNENPWPWSQKVNCGPIMPGHILFLTALPPYPPYHDLPPPCHLSLYFCCSSTDVVRKRSNFFCFWKQTVLGMITAGSSVDWISQDVRSCRNSTASKVYKEERLFSSPKNLSNLIVLVGAGREEGQGNSKERNVWGIKGQEV